MNLQESIRRILREKDRYDDKVGKIFWFEYHCYESPKSCDSEIWYRSHQKVKVIGVSEWSFDDYEDRINDGQPRVYTVEWGDGFQHDVFEDELLDSPDEFYRPHPPERKIQESIRRILREEINENDLIVYHGTPQKHEFNKEGHMFGGTFFSLSQNEAKSYGEYVYKVLLNRDLNLIDTGNFKDCELIMDEFETLIDPYYDEDDDNYYITEPEQLYYNSDSWSAIESNDDVMEWLEGNYDGVWIYEGGVRNLLLFKPIKEKIERIEII